jgi:putative colanic acid biosynthesis glycosyltransferase
MISIITVVKNNLNGVIRTQKSIYQQLHIDWQWVIVSALSSDGTVEYLNSISDNRVKICIGMDSGLYDAMNIGTRLADGSHIIYLNAGDNFHDEHSLEQLVNESSLRSHDVILGAAFYTNSRNINILRSPRVPKRSIWYGNPAIHQAVLFPKKILGENPYNTKYLICADYALFSQLYKQNFNFVLYNYPVIDFELGGTSQQNKYKLIKEAMLIQKVILNIPIPFILLSAFVRFFKLLIISLCLSFSNLYHANKVTCK